MEKIYEIRQALIETYNKSFNLKEPTGSLFSEIEILMLMIDEDPEAVLSQYDEREIQMYNYLINEMIMVLRKRSTERLNAARLVKNVVEIRKPRPITAQPNRRGRKRKIIEPNFEISADLALLVESLAMDQRNRTSDFVVRGNDHRQTSPRGIAPTVPPRSQIVRDERSLEIALQKSNIHPPTSENIDKEMFPSTSEVQLFRNLEEIEEHPVHLPLLDNVVPLEERELIRDFDLPTSDAIRFSTMPTTSEIQQFGNIVDVEEALVTLPDSSLPLRRIDLPSTKELSSKQRVQFDELEVNLPEIPPEDDFIQEFRALFERRRREKAATDYAERATIRAKRSTTNLKYRDFSRIISPLISISEEAHIQSEMSLFSQKILSTSNQIQNLFISTYCQEWYQGSSIDRSFRTEFLNLIVNRPQSTPATPYYGKQKNQKWTSSLPIVEEDQMVVQRTAEVSRDQNQITIQPKPTESHQTPLTAKNVESVGWKLIGLKSCLPVLQDEIETPPAAIIEPLPAVEIELPPEMIVQEKIQKHSKTSHSDVITTENERLEFRQLPAKRPKITTEKAYPATEVQNLTEDAVFQQYFKSWKRSLLLNLNDMHHDIHFPVDLLKMLDFGPPVHQVLKKLVDSGNNQLNYFLPPTSTKKEAAKRIHILLELRTQNVLDFTVQDGEVTGISINKPIAHPRDELPNSLVNIFMMQSAPAKSAINRRNES